MGILANPLTPETAHPSLSIISPTLTTAKTRTGNQGTSTKTPDIAPCTNTYDQAPSRTPGGPVLSASRNTARVVTTNANGQNILEIAILERHPFTSQSFIPMGGGADVSYIVVVADSDPSGSKPDLASIRAYTVKGNEGVCYGAGLWHAPMAVVGEVRDLGINALIPFRHLTSGSFSSPMAWQLKTA